MVASYNQSADEAEATTDGATVASGGIAGVSYRWVAMGVVLFGTFMVALDTTVVNLALPALQREFDTLEGIEWVVTAYLAAVGVTQMCTGWVADRFGRRASFIFALIVFTTASVLCAVSTSLGMLVAARALKGIGGGLLMPVAMAMVYELFEPEERGRALGIYGIAVMAAPAIGPVLGGGLVSSVGWRWLFLINVPIGVVGLAVALRLLRDTGFRERRPFDGTGLLLSGVGIALALIGLARGGQVGWTRPDGPLLLLIGAALLALFVRHVLRTRTPLVDLRIFASPVFAVGMVTIALYTVAQYSRLVYIPLELGTLRGVSEFHIGLVMLPSALGVATTMPLGGRLADRVGARLPVTIGVSLLAVTFLGLASLTKTTPLWTVGAILFLGGLGSGLAMMAPNIVAMNSVRAAQVSQASGLSSVTRQMSAAVGTAVLAAVFAATRGASTAGQASLTPYRTVFLTAFGILLVVLLVAQRLPGKQTALALQAERRAELATERGAATTTSGPG